jgi:hypothetical protein
MNKFIVIIISISLYCFLITPVFADGVVVDKVYHPYVLPNEKELEWRMLSHKDDDGNTLAQRFAYGQSLLEDVMVEVYVVGEEDINGDFGLSAYEIETRWMLTEQGEYWADWGMLFEFEKEHTLDVWEATTGVLFEKEFGKASLAINMFIIYEWGHDIENEMESEFRVQYRYRWLPQFQPAIELYSGEDYVGIGPAFMGIQRYEGQKQLKWEAGFITGLNGDSKDHILRLAIEFEF